MPVARFQMPDGRIGRFEVPDGTSPEQAQSLIETHLKSNQQTTPKSASAGDIVNAAIGGADSLIPSALGLPMNTATDVGNLGIAAYGMGRQLVGRAMGESPSEAASHAPEPLSYDVPLSSNWFKEKIGEVLGQDVFSNPAPDSKLAQMAHTTGAVASSALLSPAKSVAEGAKNVARMTLAGGGGATAQQVAPGNPVAPALGTMLVPTATAAIRGAPKSYVNPALQDTVAEANQAGYVFPPSRISPTGDKTILESISGKRRTEVGASLKNQPITNEIISKDLRDSAETIGKKIPDGPIDTDMLTELKNSGIQSYQKVRGLGTIEPGKSYTQALDDITSKYEGAARSFPQATKNEVKTLIDSLRVKSFDAGDAVDQISILRENASKAFRSGDNALGFANKKAATALEDAIDSVLSKAGTDAEIVSEYRKARVLLAKVSNAEEALNPTTGNIDANFYRKLDDKNPKYLTGGPKLVAKVSQATDNKATQLPEKIGSPVSKLEALAGGASGAYGLAKFGWRGAVLGAIPGAASATARSIMLSKPYQSRLVDLKPERKTDPTSIAVPVYRLSEQD
jgi:hypothetical protein